MIGTSVGGRHRLRGRGIAPFAPYAAERLHAVRGAGRGQMFQCADEVAEAIRQHVAAHDAGA